MLVSKLKGQGSIYKITNIVNGKCYIGRTSDFYRRSHHYVYDFNNQRSRQINEYMLRSMIKHGIEKFTFSVIEVCDQDIMEERELFWMRYFNSTSRDFGYNLRTDECGAMIVHDLTRKKISERLKKEWADGVRSKHSEKLKISWESRDRDKQGSLFSKIKTKYQYHIKSDDVDKIILYPELKEMKLHGCINKFAKYKTDVVDFKGFRIERLRVDSYRKDTEN